MHRDGTIAPIFRRDESPCALMLMERESLLFITRHQTHLVRDDPNLQEMYGLVLRGIVFAVADSRSGAHPLHVARSDHRARSCAVFMRHGALQHVGDDFHVAVRVSRESAARINSIFVNDSQSTKAHMLRIVVITERKGMTAIEPVPPRFTSFFGRSYFNHFNPPLNFVCQKYIETSAHVGRPDLIQAVWLLSQVRARRSGG